MESSQSDSEFREELLVVHIRSHLPPIVILGLIQNPEVGCRSVRSFFRSMYDDALHRFHPHL